jgi:hypothetical protein
MMIAKSKICLVTETAECKALDQVNLYPLRAIGAIVICNVQSKVSDGAVLQTG